MHLSACFDLNICVHSAIFDIMPTKDGVWVLIHGDTVDRTMSGKGMKNEALIIDFDEERITELRRLVSEIEFRILTNTVDESTIEFAKTNSTAIGFNFGVPENYLHLKDVQSQGIMCAAWTVDYLPVLDLLSAPGVDYITTNRILP